MKYPTPRERSHAGRGVHLRVVLSLILFTTLATSARAQSVKLPGEVRGDPGAWIVVVPESKEGGKVKWHVSRGLTLVPIDKLFPGQEAAGVVVQGSTGTYEVWAWSAKGDVASDLAVCKIHTQFGELFYLMNQWGLNAHGKDPFGGPPGGVWITASDVDYICRDEVYAFSGKSGYPAPPISVIPWSFM